MHHLLIACCCMLSQALPTQTSKPQLLRINKPVLFEQLTADLNPDRLFRLYRTNLKLKQVRRNRHEPAVKDSVVTVSTPADQLTLFKNRYNTLLLSARFTSNKVKFGGLQIGVTKEIFCRTLHVSPAYTVYAFTDGMEDFVQLTCTFAAGKLKTVEYKYLINPDSID
jgi:hypothetical protein